ncbi:uncharacterized protein LOC115594724 [Sparus aurata]|uniref:uncharacterized protein LOC115594724 n=1 Tax=Sparus aurata TaxID=8175 RepID=UPI0011C0F06D|nr:uncharacterized protein LOC115594724 [Sparus aurata]
MAGQTSHDSGLWDFLRKRGVAEENIDRMQQDKIDSSLVREIEDAYLARYIPVYGDRIALRRYCLDKEKQKDNSSRMSLLEKLRKKLKTATAGQDEESEQEPWPAKSAKKPSRDCSKNAVKSSRKIELGWIHEGKQMRKRSGGGTRVLEVSKNSTKTDILSHAKELFFPGGESTKGKWEDFLHDIYDFKESRLDESSTVGGNPHNDPPSEIQLDDAVPVFTAVEEVINDAPSTSTPVSGDHDQNTDDYSSFDAGFDQHHMQMVCPEMPMLLFGQSSWILQQRGRK